MTMSAVLRRPPREEGMWMTTLNLMQMSGGGFYSLLAILSLFEPFYYKRPSFRPLSS